MRYTVTNIIINSHKVGYTVTRGLSMAKDKGDKKTVDMFKESPKTNTQRQQAYRERKKAEKGQRLDMMINLETAVQLDALSQFFGVSKKETVEKLIQGEFIGLSNTKDFGEFMAKFNAR